MDLNDGSCSLVPVKSENGQISFDMELPPIGSALYFLTKTNTAAVSASAIAATATATNGSEIPIENPVSEQVETTVKQEADNVLVLDFLDLKGKKSI